MTTSAEPVHAAADHRSTAVASPQTATARDRLAAATRQAHEALHRHPLFAAAPQTATAPARDRLAGILAAFAGFYEKVERARTRQGVWPDLTLRPELDALAWDLSERAPMARPSEGAAPDCGWLGDPHRLLGALYVAHGAAFGRSTLARSLSLGESAAASRFLELRPSPARWRVLTACLAREGGDPAAERAMTEGANAAFALFGAMAAAPDMQKTEGTQG